MLKTFSGSSPNQLLTNSEMMCPKKNRRKNVTDWKQVRKVTTREAVNEIRAIFLNIK